MNIMNAEVTFPGFNLLTHKPLALTPACINFVSGLLERNLHKRLGCGPRGIVDIMEHPWFDEIDWAAVERMELTPIFVPDVGTLPYASAIFSLSNHYTCSLTKPISMPRTTWKNSSSTITL